MIGIILDDTTKETCRQLNGFPGLVQEAGIVPAQRKLNGQQTCNWDGVSGLNYLFKYCKCLHLLTT